MTGKFQSSILGTVLILFFMGCSSDFTENSSDEDVVALGVDSSVPVVDSGESGENLNEENLNESERDGEFRDDDMSKPDVDTVSNGDDGHETRDGESNDEDHEGHEVPGTGLCSEGLNELILIVDPGEGGTVTAEPKGVDGTYCYSDGTVVELFAVPAEGWIFNAWKGSVKDEIEASGENKATMDENKEARALFKSAEEVVCGEGLLKLTLRVQHTEGSEIVYNEAGKVDVVSNPASIRTSDPDVTCYEPGTLLNFTVVANEGFSFSRWKGKSKSDITGEFPNFTLQLPTEAGEEESEKTVRAEFLKQ